MELRKSDKKSKSYEEPPSKKFKPLPTLILPVKEIANRTPEEIYKSLINSSSSLTIKKLAPSTHQAAKIPNPFYQKSLRKPQITAKPKSQPDPLQLPPKNETKQITKEFKRVKVVCTSSNNFVISELGQQQLPLQLPFKPRPAEDTFDFECSICGEMFKNKNQLTNHRRSHRRFFEANVEPIKRKLTSSSLVPHS